MRVWGISRNRSRASRLARSVTSSSAPPSTYSNAKPGTRRRAISRRWAMLSARDRSVLPNGRRFQGMRDLLHQGHADARGDEGVGADIVLPDRDQPVDLVGAVEGRGQCRGKAADAVEYRHPGAEGCAADRELQLALICPHGRDQRAGGEGAQRLQVQRRRPGADLVNGPEVGVVQGHDQAGSAVGEEGRGRTAVDPFNHQALFGRGAGGDGGGGEVRRRGTERVDHAVDLQQRARGGGAFIERAGVDDVGAWVGSSSAGAGEVEAGRREVAERQDIERGTAYGRGVERTPDTGRSEAQLARRSVEADVARGVNGSLA